MNLIHAAAENTLALDSELEQISQTFDEQMGAHVLCSSWMTRCWTIQEARLFPECYIQFADWNYHACKHSSNDSTQLELELILWYYLHHDSHTRPFICSSSIS